MFVAGCGGGSVTPPGGDGGVDTGLPMQDGGPGVDSGPVVPPYAPLPLECRGDATSCREADGSRTFCESIRGCDYGYCSYRPIACVAAFYQYECESGCFWDGDRCSTIRRGCEFTNEADCARFDACYWRTASEFIFTDTPCQGNSTECDTLSVGVCESQPGCEVGCPTGRTECLGACVDTRRDDNHCGACGTACGADASCVQGTCTCDEPGFTRDLCGVCDADPTNDCVRDCGGVPGGNAVEDDCGTCDANPANDCDCAGVPGGSSVVDMCGACDALAGNDCVQDCAGAWGGAATVDDCGVCDANPANDCDCLMVPGGPAYVDQCGVCDADASNDCAIDCSGVWGGPDRQDMCGVCDPNPSNDCVQDCSGQWGGVRTVDMCGVCDANPNNDCVQDCADVWGGTAMVDNCGTCDANPTNDCVCFGQTCVASGPCFEGYCDLVTDTCQERAFADATPCGDTATQHCSATECVTRGCGDGIRETGLDVGWLREGCDDRNLSNGDICSDACVPTEFAARAASGAEEYHVRLAGGGHVLVMDGLGNGLLVWVEEHYEFGASGTEVRASRIDRYGNFLDLAAPFLLHSASSTAFDMTPTAVGLKTGGFVVAWTMRDPSSAAFVLRMRGIAADGTMAAAQAVHGTMSGAQRYARMAALDDSFVIVWQDDSGEDIWARRFRNNGTALTPVLAVNTTTMGRQLRPAIAAHGNAWMVAYLSATGAVGSGTSLRARRYADSAPVGNEFVIRADRANALELSNVHPDGDSYLLVYASSENGNQSDLYSMTVPRSAGGTLGASVSLDLDPSRGAANMQVAPYGTRGMGGYVVVYTDSGSNPEPLFLAVGVTPPSELGTLQMALGEDYPAVAAAPYDLTSGSVWVAYSRQVNGFRRGAVVFQLPPP